MSRVNAWPSDERASEGRNGQLLAQSTHAVKGKESRSEWLSEAGL